MTEIENEKESPLIGQKMPIEIHDVRKPQGGLGDICPSDTGTIFEVWGDGRVLIQCDRCVYKELQEAPTDQRQQNA